MARLVFVGSSEWIQHNTNQCDFAEKSRATTEPLFELRVADNRVALGSSGREDVLNRDRETRPTALVPVEVRKGQRNDNPLDNRERGEVEERVRETRPDAPEPVTHPEHLL